MINLLPPDMKRQLRAGRSNVLLLRYNILMVVALVFLVLAIGVTYFYLQNAKANATKTLSDDQQRAASYSSVQVQANSFRSSLSKASQILNNEIDYSKPMILIASLIPSGVVLQNLQLSAQSFGTPLSLVAEAKSEANAVTLKNNFQNSPYFTNVHFTSLTSSTSTSSSYPITVNLTVTMSKEAAQ